VTPVLRPARDEDAAALTRVARAAKASWGYPEVWLREWEAQLTITRDYLRRNHVIVAELEGRVVAFGALVGISEGADLDHLWVLPEAQGAGIGRALFEGLVEAARASGARALRIDSDPNSRAFYERLGAHYVGERPAPVAGVARTLPVLSFPL